MTTFNFSANTLDLGNWTADTQAQAQELFAKDSGYPSWAAMVEQAEEFGGNNVEVCALDPEQEFQVQQKTQYQWEPIENGEFKTEAEALAAKKELIANCGWDENRVRVIQIDKSL